MDEKLTELESRVAAIESRNSRVTMDKAWETSYVRIGIICVITYVFAVLVLNAIGNDRPLFNALIPVLGFFLSTQSLPFLKNWWAAHRKDPGT